MKTAKRTERITKMPLRMSVLCTAQAVALDFVPCRELCVFTQSVSGLFDRSLKRSRVSLGVVVVQSLLNTAALLLPLAARAIHSERGDSSTNALVKTLTPFMTMLMLKTTNWTRWCAAIVSYSGFVLAVSRSDTDYDWQTLLSHALLFVAALCGAALGVYQQRFGACYFEVTCVTAVICAANLFRPWFGALDHWRLRDVVTALLYGVVSFWVQREVRQYSESVQYNAYKLNMALNERRALTALCAINRHPTPWRLVVGTLLAVVGAQWAVSS